MAYATALHQILKPPPSPVGSPPAAPAIGAPPLSASSSPSPDIFEQAKQRWSILNNPNIFYQYTPRSGEHVPFLEAFPPGESGSPNEPRPAQFPMDKYGIQVFKPTTRPVDVLGDVVSHFLRNTDPVIKNFYASFEQSLTPQQHARLQQQYQYEMQNNGEKRPFAQWYQQSGLPSYFRGYAFQQWPNAKQFYTPEQLKSFDAMMQYLAAGQAGGSY